MAEREREIVNFQTRKTEEGWGNSVDNFYLKAVPLWFNWLEWVLILGAIKLIAVRTNDSIVNFVYSISIWLMGFYLFAFFYHYDFHGIPKIKSENWRRFFSAVITLAITFGVYHLFISLVEKLKM